MRLSHFAFVFENAWLSEHVVASLVRHSLAVSSACGSREVRLHAACWPQPRGVLEPHLLRKGGACIHATGLDNFSFVQSGGPPVNPAFFALQCLPQA